MKMHLLECVKCLLDHGAAKEIDNKFLQDETALIICARLGHEECVKILLDYGADMSIIDKGGRTALDNATNKNVIGSLRKSGGSSSKQKNRTLL
jgi:ankyrin repeat protein